MGWHSQCVAAERPCYTHRGLSQLPSVRAPPIMRPQRGRPALYRMPIAVVSSKEPKRVGGVGLQLLSRMGGQHCTALRAANLTGMWDCLNQTNLKTH